MIRGIQRTRPQSWSVPTPGTRSNWLHTHSPSRTSRPHIIRPYSEYAIPVGPQTWFGDESSSQYAAPSEREGKARRREGAQARRWTSEAIGDKASSQHETPLAGEDIARAHGSAKAQLRTSDETAADHVSGAWRMTGMLPLFKGSSLLDIDYAGLLGNAVTQGQFDLVLRCLFAAAKQGDVAFINAIPPAQFTSILCILAPRNTMGQLMSLYRSISFVQEAGLGVVPMHVAAHQYSLILRAIWRMRRAARATPSLEDYEILLQGAGDLGNQSLARTLFRQMGFDGHSANVSCWTSYLEASLLTGQHRAITRFTTRATSRNVQMRKARSPLRPFINYRLGSAPSTLKSTVSQQLDTMFSNGVTADQGTYRILLTAAARQNNISAVSEILKTAWGIDVQAWQAGATAIDNTSETAVVDPSEVDAQTLLAVTHAFLTMNDLPSALRALDFFNRGWNISVPIDVWETLFEHAYALTRDGRRQVTRKQKHQSHKQPVSLADFDKLWQTMISAPYNVQPTMRIRYLYIKSLLIARQVPQAIDGIHACQLMLRDVRTLAKKRWESLDVARTAKHGTTERLRRDWELVDVQVRLYARWIRDLVRRVLECPLHNSRFMEEMTLQTIPGVLRHFHMHLPSKIAYEVPGGLVEFNYRSVEEKLESKLHEESRAKQLAELQQDAPRLFGQGHHYKVGRGPRKVRPYQHSSVLRERTRERISFTGQNPYIYTRAR